MNCWRARTGLRPCEDDMPPIPLPDVRQTTAHGCGDAALRVVWDHFGITRRPPVSHPIDGTSPDVIEMLLWKSGLLVQSGAMDADDLRYHTGRGRPVLCCVDLDGVGHWVVVSGVRYSFVYYQCPATGPGRESVAAFTARWKDWTRRGVDYHHWGVAAGVG